MRRLVLNFVVALVLAPFAGSAAGAADRTEVVLVGAPDRGIFDPSVTAAPGALYMSVSGVSSTAAGSGIDSLAVRTYLAVSHDQGNNWRLTGGTLETFLASVSDRQGCAAV